MNLPAKTHEDAFNALDPHRAVQPGEVDELFVLRPYSPTKELEVRLKMSDRPQKMLFVGHRGSGKSSELAYLRTRLDKRFVPIVVPLYDIFQSPAVSHIELVFAMTLRLSQVATDEDIVPSGVVRDAWNKTFEEVFKPLRALLFGSEPVPGGTSPDVSVKLSVLAAELEAKIGTESYTRNKVKEQFEGQIADLLNRIKELATLLEKHANRQLLLIIEDLDKFDRGEVRKLFLDHARTLTGVYPSIIYTFPISIRYDNEFLTIEQSFDKEFMLPNIALHTRQGDPNEHGKQVLAEIILKRVTADLFEDGVIERLIHISGGHVRNLIRLTQQAVVQARIDETAAVQLAHLEPGRRQFRDDYMALLKREQIDLLCQLRDDPDKSLVDVTEVKQSLLFNGSLLEYGDEQGPWVDINPIVLEILDRECR